MHGLRYHNQSKDLLTLRAQILADLKNGGEGGQLNV
jgi:hypothetical protein